MLERRKAGEGRKVQNMPDSFLLTEHSAISNGFIVSDFFPPPSVWCEITAPLSTRCIFRFALPAVTHCFYLAFCCLRTTLVQPFKTLGPIVLHQSGWALLLSLLVIQIIHQTICQRLLTAHMIKGSGSNGIKGSYGFEYWILHFVPLES